MSLDEKFIPIRTGFYQMIDSLFKKLAGLFGYPANPGMPTSYDLPDEASLRSRFLENLPVHQTFWPPIQRPENWFETIVGSIKLLITTACLWIVLGLRLALRKILNRDNLASNSFRKTSLFSCIS